MREIKTGKSGQQRGAVLIVALIMLLLLTLVGVAGIRDTQLQEKMAGGTEDRAIAFQAAESALREGESLIMDGICTGTCADKGYYEGVTLPTRDNNGATTGGDPVSEAAFWANHFSDDGVDARNWADLNKVKVYTGGGTLLPDVNTQPRYVIELMPDNFSPLPNTTNANYAGPNRSTIKDYLITARGTGRTNSAVVILQSLYRYSSPVTP